MSKLNVTDFNLIPNSVYFMFVSFSFSLFLFLSLSLYSPSVPSFLVHKHHLNILTNKPTNQPTNQHFAVNHNGFSLLATRQKLTIKTNINNHKIRKKKISIIRKDKVRRATGH